MDLINQSGVDALNSSPKFSRNIAGTTVSIDHLPSADDFSSGEGTDTTDDDERPLTRELVIMKGLCVIHRSLLFLCCNGKD